MSDHDFQLEVIEALSELRTDMRAVKEHLAALNGKVLKHEIELSERRGSEQASSKWTKHLLPVLGYATGAVLTVLSVLALHHAGLFVK